jgi:very-short-patch-repair endonuclease
MKCWTCGKEAEPTYKVTRGRKIVTKNRAYCPECLEKHNEEIKHDKELHVILKKKVMFERAMELMEKQGCDMSKYRNAAVMVQKYLYSNWDKFDSADEVIAAIVLIKNGLQVKMQCKVGRYQIDIVIPEKKIALEIDGDRHRLKRDYDTWRDIEIKNALGDGWEIVRISTSHIEKDCEKLIKAIDAVKEYKQAKK